MLDQTKANHAVEFIHNLKHTKGIWHGVPFDLLPWQEQIVRDIFGTVKDNGYRQYNTAYVEIPKKNGKSEIAAAVALYLTCADSEWGAEVYGCASDRQQASIVFDVAVDMVEQCPALKKRIKTVLSQKRLVFQPLNSFYQVLSAEAYTKHGLNVHGVVFDELHAQPNRELYDIMTKGSGDARMQPLFFLITTAGNDRNSICWEIHQKAVDVLAGRKFDPTFYPVIFGIDDDDDWADEANWYKANPSLDHTIDIQKVRDAFNSAKENPAEENLFRQLRLNQWVKQSVRWMPIDTWDKCSFPVKVEELKGRVCYAGLDLSSTTDITAFVLVFPPRNEDEKYQVLPFFWIPEDNLRLRVRRDHVPYDIWKQQGFLLTTEGNVVHYGYIEAFIEDLGKEYDIREIAFDRWGAVQMSQNLEGLGFTVVPFGQGYKDMSPATKELMKLTLEGKLAHGGQPVLRWMVDNIHVRTDPAGNIKPDKEKSTERIDGAVALIMALDRALRNENNGGSVYDTRGIRSVKGVKDIRIPIPFTKRSFDISIGDTTSKGFFRGGKSIAGVSVTERNALQIMAVLACVKVISETVASLPLPVYRRLKPRGKERAPDHSLYPILHDLPNPEMTSFTWRETMQSHALTWGNAYSEIEYDENWYIKALWPLLPDRTYPVRDTTSGAISFVTSLPNGQQVSLSQERVLHIPGLGFDGLKGYSPIALAREAIGVAKAAEEFGGRFFANGAHLGGVLEHPGQLSDKAYDRLKEEVEELSGLTKSHRLKILEEGMKYTRIGIPPNDAQFLETRKFQIEEIARIYRVPLHMIQNLDRATFSNIEQQSLEFVIHTIRPWLVRWEQSLTWKLLTPSERKAYLVEFLVDGLLRGDIKSRYEAYSIAKQNGWMNSDDIRELENQNPLKGGQGQIYYVPLNMIPADQVGDYWKARQKAFEAKKAAESP